MSDDGLFLGRPLGGADGRVCLDPDHLTTHAVCLGMTGSGKTGLGIVALEELARRGTPLLVVDLKGDMANLLLSFPGLSAEEFEAWVPADEVEEGGRRGAAETVAARWRKGLAGSGLDGEDIAAMKEGVRWQLLTPGAGVAPLDVLPALGAPDGVEPGSDAARDRLDASVSGLLALVGRGGDPLTDSDHVLMAACLDDAWRRGASPDLAGLLGLLADPPFDSLGVLPLETAYPRKDRMGLVMELNTLLASPAFSVWTRGVPLSMDALLGSSAEPRATVLSVAHLDERQRMFVLTLVLGELLAWTRRRSGSGSLEALLYLDEVQGILPPHPANPPTKRPLLTLLKQGRAFGVGAWLATQNPVDLDYKALGNAGVKVIGRLVTERDRERALEGLGVGARVDDQPVDDLVSALGKREFVLENVRDTPRVRTFSSRWAMSYLRGPLMLGELKPLVTPSMAPESSTDVAGAAQKGRGTPPVLPVELPVRYVDGPPRQAEPRLWVRCRATIRRKGLDLERTLDQWWRIPLGGGSVAWDSAEEATPPELLDGVPKGLVFPSAAPAAEALKDLDDELVRWRARQPVEVLIHDGLDLVAAPGEDREAFVDRCLEAADREDDDDQERLRKRYEKKIATLKRRLEREEGELERDSDQLESRKAEEKLGLVEGFLSVLTGSRSLSSAARKASSKARSAATKRRMRQRAEAAVEESEQQIQSLLDQIEDLEIELELEVEEIAAASEALAGEVETVGISPYQKDVQVVERYLVWG